jgi:hypothetical protein
MNDDKTKLSKSTPHTDDAPDDTLVRCLLVVMALIVWGVLVPLAFLK